MRFAFGNTSALDLPSKLPNFPIAEGSSTSMIRQQGELLRSRALKSIRAAPRLFLVWLPAPHAARRIRIMVQRDIPYAAIFGLPHGAVGVTCTPSVVAGLDFLPAQPELTPRLPLAIEAVRQLRAWLREPAFRFDLPLAPVGSAFQRRVWQEISSVPCGETLTYGELARRTGSAARAVGQACGANRYPIVVPCHRVVASTFGRNGGLGGFAHATGGFLLDLKCWLLERECPVRLV